MSKSVYSLPCAALLILAACFLIVQQDNGGLIIDSEITSEGDEELEVPTCSCELRDTGGVGDQGGLGTGARVDAGGANGSQLPGAGKDIDIGNDGQSNPVIPDKNSDGIIGEDSADQGDVQIFDKLDENGDGRIGPEDSIWSAVRSLDEDNSGHVDKRELKSLINDIRMGRIDEILSRISGVGSGSSGKKQQGHVFKDCFNVSIQGTVYAPDGAPCSKYDLVVTMVYRNVDGEVMKWLEEPAPSGAQYASSKTHPDICEYENQFEMDGPGASDYKVHLFSSKALLQRECRPHSLTIFISASHADHAESAPIIVGPTIEVGTMVHHASVDLYLQRPLNIKGRLTNENGEPITETTVMINYSNHEDDPVLSIRDKTRFADTDRNGYFVIGKAVAGTYKYSGLLSLDYDLQTPADPVVIPHGATSAVGYEMNIVLAVGSTATVSLLLEPPEGKTWIDYKIMRRSLFVSGWERAANGKYVENEWSESKLLYYGTMDENPPAPNLALKLSAVPISTELIRVTVVDFADRQKVFSEAYFRVELRPGDEYPVQVQLVDNDDGLLSFSFCDRTITSAIHRINVTMERSGDRPVILIYSNTDCEINNTDDVGMFIMLADIPEGVWEVSVSVYDSTEGEYVGFCTKTYVRVKRSTFTHLGALAITKD